MFALFISSYHRGMGNRFFTTNFDLVLSPIQQEILVGGLLGDISLARAKPTHNARLAVRHSTKQTEYTMYLFSIFKVLCTPTLELIVNEYFDKRLNKLYFNISFYTRSLPCLNYYRDLFYPNGVKVVPENIGELLTDRGLAIWAQDDGYKDRNAFRFATESFTLAET